MPDSPPDPDGNDNRIARVTPANAAENARLAPVAPADGTLSLGWRLALTVAASVLGAVGVALAAPVVTPALIVGAVIVGASSGLAAFAGTSSAGRRP